MTQTSSNGGGVPPTGEVLHAPLARLLRPLVRLLVRVGVTYPALCDLLRELYVNVAEHDFALAGKEQTDSRVSLLTGIHRKEVRRLRGAGTPVSTMPAALSRTSLILSRWIGSPAYRDATGQPLPLPRASRDPSVPSFEALVESVTRDVRPRAVLDEWLDQGLATVDPEGRIVLAETALVPPGGSEAQAYYFGRNLHDHVAAAAANLTGRGPRFLERAVHYDGLTAEQAAELEAVSRELAMTALTAANAEALRRIDPASPDPASSDSGQAEAWRWSFGTYVYREPVRTTPEAEGQD